MRAAIAAVSFASIAAFSIAARAEVDLSATAPPPPEPANAYVEFGMLWGSEHWIGGDTWTIAGAALAVGHRIWRLPLWARATTVLGDGTTPAINTAVEMAPAGQHTLYELRAGLELRGCVVRYVCASVGADVALHVESWTETNEGGWGSHTDYSQEGVVIPRVGLAIGNKLQLRPSVELALGFTDRTYTLDLAVAAAYRW